MWQQVDQDNTNAGCFDSVIDINKFQLLRGDCGCIHATSGPNHDGCRGGTLILQCGSTSANVNENSECVYDIILTDPGLCCRQGYYGPVGANGVSGGPLCFQCGPGALEYV